MFNDWMLFVTGDQWEPLILSLAAAEPKKACQM